MKNLSKARTSILGMLALIFLTVPALAADERKLGWSDTGELSFVGTAGNTSTSTLGFKNTLIYLWERSGLTFNAGAIHASSKEKQATAVRTATSYRTIDGDETTTAAIRYTNGRYDHKITDRFFWYGGAGWDRNRGAGVKNRYLGEGGVGNLWYESPTFKFQTSYAVTFTHEEDYVEVEGFDDSFAGLRLSYDLMKKFGEPTTFTSRLVVDDNLETSQDYRADMINSVAVAMSNHLALKVSLQWLYDNEPGHKDLALAGRQNPIHAELDNLDTIFTASVVANF